MNPEHRRQERLRWLTAFFVKSNFNHDKLLYKIKKMGVSNPTAKDYYQTVLQRVERIAV